MKKTGSTGNLFYNDQFNTLRPISTMRQKKFNKISNYIPYSLNSFEIDAYNNNYNYEHLLLNKTPKQLYDGLMSLKKRVNYLNEEISLAKSAQRKKDVQLSLKNKEIEEYMSDIKMSKDLNPINIDKLKEINIITKLKNEYNSLKSTLDEIKNKKNNLEIKLKRSRPNKVKQINSVLEKRLKLLLMEYNVLHQNNAAIHKQLEDMKNLPKIFAENHKIIETLKNRIDEQEKNVIELKEQINEVNNKRNLNEILLDRQKIKNINLNQKNQYLENEIQTRKKVEQMKANYDNKIQKLNEKKKQIEEKFRNQERAINTIKREIRISEEKKKVDPLKLKKFNYTAISKVESNPQDEIDSRLILLQSLLDESLNKKKKYQDSIQSCIEKFKELGYDYKELDKVIEESKDIVEDDENNKEKEEPNENNEIKNDINSEEKNNNEINENNNNNDEKVNIQKEEINEKLDKENENENNNNNLDKNINNNLNNDNNNKSKIEEEIISENKQFNENNQEKNANKEIENKDLIQKNENEILPQKSNNDIVKPEDMKNLNIEPNNNPKNIKIKEKSDNAEISNHTINDEFGETTFILIKCFEVKKINEELARQKIIIISTKDPLEKNTFVEQMSFNIMKTIHCENKDSLEKVKNWLNTFLTMFDNDQKKMTESFLSLFKEVNTYNTEKELIYSKKIKKYLFKKNPDFAKKLEPYKNKYITFDYIKKLLEEHNIDLKDDYSQYLYYELKKYDDPQASIFDLKVDNLFKIFEDKQNDSKMEEESDIEITQDQYVNIIYNIGTKINKYLDTNKKSLKEAFGDKIKDLSGEEVPEKDRIEIIAIEDFIEKMKEFGITINTEIEIYCLFSRYKITDDYGIISINLLNKDLENFREKKIEDEDNKNHKEINEDINQINQINDIDRLGVGIEAQEKNNIKVMEKVQEENEENASNSENK